MERLFTARQAGVKKGVGINIEDLGNAIADNTSDGMVLVNTYNEEGNG